MDVAERLFTPGKPGTILIAAGDADYVPVVSRAQEKGWAAEVWFWSNAAGDLKEACSRYVELDSHIEYLRFGGDAALPAW